MVLTTLLYIATNQNNKHGKAWGYLEGQNKNKNRYTQQ